MRVLSMSMSLTAFRIIIRYVKIQLLVSSACSLHKRMDCLRASADIVPLSQFGMCQGQITNQKVICSVIVFMVAL
jgi:hypothetical protein